MSDKPESTAIESTAIESALISGDLAKLNTEQRLSYYNKVCESLGLNPLTQPFAYINLNGKLTLYAKRDATEQLRKVHKVSINITARETINDVYVVTAWAKDHTGREDESTGAVYIAGLKGDSLANAFLKAETKAKRRVTLSICGLGLLDETEIDNHQNKNGNIAGIITSHIDGESSMTHENRAKNYLAGEAYNCNTTSAIIQPRAAPIEDLQKKNVIQKSLGYISDEKRKWLWAIFKKSGWSDDQLKVYLKNNFNNPDGSTYKIKDGPSFDLICKVLEDKTDFTKALAGDKCDD